MTIKKEKAYTSITLHGSFIYRTANKRKMMVPDTIQTPDRFAFSKFGSPQNTRNILKYNTLTNPPRPSFNSMQIGEKKHADWREKATSLEGKGMEIETHHPRAG